MNDLKKEAERIVLAYARCADERRGADLVALFTDDGVVDLGEKQLTGKAELAAFYGGNKPVTDRTAPQRTKHFITNVVAESTGSDTASAQCYFQMFQPTGLAVWGRYLDDLVRTDGGWRIARRTVVVDGTTTPPPA
ncbi:MAG TPA: nuclear transport factor 2 family protein [Mycobacteriales bacterium]|nr:nuclear transport factor 2 family protein [Mycobacteriales bacterium]